MENPAPILKCTECGEFETRSNAELISHKRKHGPDKQFECDECDYTCKHKKSLNSHKRKQHGDGKDLHTYVVSLCLVLLFVHNLVSSIWRFIKTTKI